MERECLGEDALAHGHNMAQCVEIKDQFLSVEAQSKVSINEPPRFVRFPRQ